MNLGRGGARVSRFFLALSCLCFLAFFSGCDRKVTVSGRVLDVRGEALPGVAVTLDGTEAQALTNGLGEYTLDLPPNAAMVTYLKAGYTPGSADLRNAAPAQQGLGGRYLNVVPIKLWPVPPGKGLFTFDSAVARYQATTLIEPRRYVARNQTPIVGSALEPERDIMLGAPLLLVCYKLPDFDLRLERMAHVEAALPQSDMADLAFTEHVWVKEVTLPTVARPIDEPGRMLVEVQPLQPLEPGVYAVHWGVLDGYASMEPRVYCFRVVDPKAPAAEGGQEGDQEGEASKPKKPNQEKPAAPAEEANMPFEG